MLYTEFLHKFDDFCGYKRETFGEPIGIPNEYADSRGLEHGLRFIDFGSESLSLKLYINEENQIVSAFAYTDQFYRSESGESDCEIYNFNINLKNEKAPQFDVDSIDKLLSICKLIHSNELVAESLFIPNKPKNKSFDF